MAAGKTYTIHLKTDFAQQRVSYDITEKESGTRLVKEENVETDAKNLATMTACSYYTANGSYAAGQQIDNFLLCGEQELELPLEGKTLYAFGDSIVNGHKYEKASFPNFVARLEGMNFTNDQKFSLNGSTILKSKKQILSQIQKAPQEAPDYVLLDGGINDAYETLDDSEFSKAFEATLTAIMEKWPTAKLLYVAVHKTNTREAAYQERVYTLATDVCSRLGVKVADLYGLEDYDCLNIPENVTKYAFDELGENGLPRSKGVSATHPNLDAIETFFVPVVSAALRELEQGNTDTGILEKAQAAQAAAEAAKTAAEAARGEANTAKAGAQTAQEAAETARSEANTAKEAAEKARDEAKAAKEAAETARDEANAAQEKAQTAKTDTETAKEAAEKAKEAAETAEANAESAQKKAEAAEKEAAAAQEKAEAAQAKAEAAQSAAETAAQKAAETAKTDAVQAAADAAKALEGAKTAQGEAEAARDSAAAAKDEAVQAGSQAVQARDEAAAARDAAEAAKDSAASYAQAAETAQAAAKAAADAAQAAAKAAAETLAELRKEADAKLKEADAKLQEEKKIQEKLENLLSEKEFTEAKAAIGPVKSLKKKQAKVKWKAVEDADGYVIQYAKNAKFKNAKTVKVKDGGTLQKTVKKLSGGKKYYFRVRAYKEADGKTLYTGYSKKKAVKVK